MLHSFDAIYVINLASRPDRRAEMSRQLARQGLSFSSPNVHLFPGIRPTDSGGFESLGARGCFMSHLGVLRDATGRRNVLILEDDLDFAENFAPVDLPDDWGVFYGSARHSLSSELSLTIAPPEAPIECAHFVAFNGNQIQPVIEFLELLLSRDPGDPRGGPMHVDGAYSEFRRRNPEVRTYVATPDLGFQRSSKSDIAAAGWIDRFASPRISSLARRARRVLRQR